LEADLGSHREGNREIELPNMFQPRTRGHDFACESLTRKHCSLGRQANVRFGSKADMTLWKGDLRYSPKSGHCPARLGCPLSPNRRHRGLFDHLIGATDQWQRHCDTQVFGGLEVDDQLDLRGLLDWHFGRLLPMEDAAGVNAHLPIRIGKISPVANQAAPRGERTKLVDRGHRVADG
jgi:hypothetical protein